MAKIEADTTTGKLIQEAANGPQLFEEEIVSKYRGFHVIYTDGSKSQTYPAAGCGIFCENPVIDLAKSIPKEATINTAEAHAILIALTKTRDKNLNKILLVTDSKSAADSISNPGINAQHPKIICDI